MEAASEVVKSVHFSFYTPKEIRMMSVKRITRPDLLDAKGSPVPDGLYDPALGPLNDIDPCKSCGQLSVRCPGHFGHIDLAKPLYNPLLFKNLQALLQVTCFHCHKFKSCSEKIQRCIAQLDHIIKGDVVGARNLADESMSESFLPEATSAASVSSGSNFGNRSLKESTWTSIQYDQARIVLSEFMKEKPKKCGNCGRKNPTITCPTFGWFNKEIKDSDVRANYILGSELGLSSSDAKDAKASHSEEDNNSQMDEEPILSRKAAKGNHLSDLPSEIVRKVSSSGQKHLLPSEVELILKNLWKNEMELCSLICDIQRISLSESGRSKGYLMFFLKALLVPPSKFRPTAGTSSRGVLEHPQNILLMKVQESNIAMRNSIDANPHSSDIWKRWMDLQKNVNVLFDSSKGYVKSEKEASGIRQMLEKKSGILRQKMMGKRVNFACRSVISPDPYLAVNEIGIPPFFAMRLTYPERVTPWNVNKLCDSIINGFDHHPGATHYKDKEGMRKLHPSQQMRIVKKLSTSRGVVTQQGKGPESEFESKVVYRHLQDGDIVLVNRQPTLHKPSMMAHVVRVLKGEKTIRMHYTNCSTYNADFDGDEMNVHFPQDEIARAEAINIVNANKQYFVPTSGEPIRGLIQDHIVSAVLLTKMNTFLTREQYHQLLYVSCVPSASYSQVKTNQLKVALSYSGEDIQPLPPAIWKPMPLWTGKQVITAILNYVTRGRLPLTVKCEGRIPKEYLKKDKKDCVRIYNNELVDGMIDKAQFGKYGLVHAVHEIYGADTAGTLLSVFSRLFTSFLQMHGFTCGVDDLLLVRSSDVEREKILGKSEAYSEDVHVRFTRNKDAEKAPMELQRKIEKILRGNGESATVRLDRMMSNSLNNLTSEVNTSLFPDGFMKTFPRNCLSLMTTTGAKGGVVNMTQISSLLGQQELEGKRVPRMVSGKTLPCFPPWDISSRAGGFISDRFLTGLRPQEYYFHCMAGRDGLVDTAIKTSRSGYLQRCLIKNLEGLKVSYDHTVRDVDGSVIQFAYGEDGVDVLKASLLSQFKMLAHNQNVLLQKFSNKFEDVYLSKPNSYVEKLPCLLRDEESKFAGILKNKKKQKRSRLGKIKRADFSKLLRLKYLSSLAEPGEPVGVVAAQSIGEPSTQMTLNTFHLAGKGEKNVTLGIPRLQEILMTASEDIRTPVMNCPLREGKTQDDAERLAAKLRRVTVADVVEAMEVCTLPFSNCGNQVSTVYKLKITLYPRELYPPHSELTIEDCMTVLRTTFVDAMEEAIEKHLDMVSKIRGINAVTGKEEDTLEEGLVEDESVNKSTQDIEKDDGGSTGDNDDVSDDDLGTDAKKRRRQESDEVEYEDDVGKEKSTMLGEHDGDHQSGFESEVDQGDTDDDFLMGGEGPMAGETTKSQANVGASSIVDDGVKELKLAGNSTKKTDAKGQKKPKVKKHRKKSRRAFFVAAEELTFEVHYDFRKEPHILLAEIAQKTAKCVYIKEFKNIESCSVPERKKNSDPFFFQTAGVNFSAFWDLEKHLDVNKLYTNDIHAMVKTYGIEAARATIIKEVSGVFGHYGIKVNIRHLTLIADFMTCHGVYRPMNRVGMGEFSTSPFGKMTFETATKFIVESAFHGEVDTLESPSASVCLGQPVKMGTGCFELMQNLQL